MLIRKKTLYITIALTASLVLLMLCSLRGVYKYRDLTRSIGILSSEVKEIWRLNNYVNEMRAFLRPVEMYTTQPMLNRSVHRAESRAQLLAMLDFVRRELNQHEERIREHLVAPDPLLATNSHELRRVRTIQRRVRQIEEAAYDANVDRTAQIDEHLAALSLELNELFGYMTDRMAGFREEMRSRYRTWIGLIVVTTLVCLMIVGGSFAFFRIGVVQPFKILLEDCRVIAKGNFSHRVRLDSNDELGELARAMNEMTERFVEIRDHLNEKVEQRTREVVRSEQLASVGYLAAGLAHEINNPLGAIAWSVDALESRLFDLLRSDRSDDPPSKTRPPGTKRNVNGHVERAESDAEVTSRDCQDHNIAAETMHVGNSSVAPTGHADEVAPGGAELSATKLEQLQVIRDYLNRIQDAAFRCREILTRLLDFARLGEASEPEEIDIHAAVADIIDLVRPVPQYRNRPIRFCGIPGLRARVRPAEFKQVVLNLLTNALDACDDGESVFVTLETRADHFVLRVVDEGCGMTEEVLQHIFRPFFTRRRDGRGTGLGLSISHQIVQDHGGELTAASAGPGQGSTFQLKMPLNMGRDANNARNRAA